MSLVRERSDGRVRCSPRISRGASSTRRTTSACVRTARSISPTPVRPHAGLRCRASAPARLPGSLSGAAWWRAAAAFGRPLAFRAAERCVFSPDEKILYVNDTVTCMIWAFEVNADGTLATGRIFASGIRSELEPAFRTA